MEIAQEYFIQKFRQLCANVTFHKVTKTYQARCSICGDSKKNNKKARLHYYLETNSVFCFNCGWSGSIFKFIKEITKMSSREIFQEAEDYDVLPSDVSINKKSKADIKSIPTLPHDSINLFDENQLKFHQDNKIVKTVLKYIKDRRIDTAVNKPKSLWLSLTDMVHKNRLIIPFYDFKGQIVFYQSREVIDSGEDLPKYLSKVGGDKTLFNIDKIDPDFPYIFIVEGPIDAMFLQNSVANTGIQEKSKKILTTVQEMQWKSFLTHQTIICLDSQWIDRASYEKTLILIEEGYNVFIWPSVYGKIFKDFNEMCVKMKIDSIPVEFITKNTFSDLTAKMRMAQVKLAQT